MESNFSTILENYLKTLGFNKPDLLIDSTSIDVVARKIEELERPLKGYEKAEQTGCYFFFDFFKKNGKETIIPIYVGKSTHLSKRLYSHLHKKDSMTSEYFSHCEEFNTCDNMLYEFTNCSFPYGECMFAIWFEPVEKERMYFEHKLIGLLRPLYNKG
jgi:hypothetical protein